MKNSGWKWRLILTLVLIVLTFVIIRMASIPSPVTEQNTVMVQTNTVNPAPTPPKGRTQIDAPLVLFGIAVLGSIWLPWLLRNKYVTYTDDCDIEKCDCKHCSKPIE